MKSCAAENDIQVNQRIFTYIHKITKCTVKRTLEDLMVHFTIGSYCLTGYHWGSCQDIHSKNGASRDG